MMTSLPRRMCLTQELVARVPRFEGPPAALPEGRVFATDDDHRITMAQILKDRPADGSVWIFAYGSLIWNPGFAFVEERLGTISGWHRSFCLGWIRLYRGCAERPGIMLALDAGGSCRGAAYRLPRDAVEDNLLPILRREHPIRGSYIPARWVTMRSASGPLRAIAFPIDRRSDGYLSDLTDAQVIEALATAAGERGTMAEYLHSTVSHLEERGIHDRYLWRLQELVAARIERAYPAPTSPRQPAKAGCL